MKRAQQSVLIVGIVGFSWLAMQAVHELGHVLGAWLTGGEVTHVALHPLAFSRTDVAPNPHPAIVVWSGPLVGCILPAAVYLAARFLRAPGLHLPRFFAGFCLIANGIYIGVDSFVKGADGGEMIRNGSPQWLLLLFAFAAIPSGFGMWNRQGIHFGLGEANGNVSRRAAATAASLFVGVIALELILGGRA